MLSTGIGWDAKQDFGCGCFHSLSTVLIGQLHLPPYSQRHRSSEILNDQPKGFGMSVLAPQSSLYPKQREGSWTSYEYHVSCLSNNNYNKCPWRMVLPIPSCISPSSSLLGLQVQPTQPSVTSPKVYPLWLLQTSAIQGKLRQSRKAGLSAQQRPPVLPSSRQSGALEVGPSTLSLHKCYCSQFLESEIWQTIHLMESPCQEPWLFS